jgi:diguanylate cyclase (GGDEF)-like protein
MYSTESEATHIREGRSKGAFTKHRTLALFTESIVSLLSSATFPQAMTDLLSLMAQTFPQSAPALYVGMPGLRSRAFSVLSRSGGGQLDARRVLKTSSPSYTRVRVGGHPPLLMNRVDRTLVDIPGARIVLSFNSGIHDGIFHEWVKILTPAMGKLVKHEILLGLAYRDGLTGLHNYRAFEEMIRSEHDRAGRYGTTFSVMMADIDWFKKVNDRFGHQTGDVVLKTLAQRMTASVRKSDRVFRYGGEEFVILLPHTGIDRAAQLAERIRLMIEKTEFVSGLRITVSIGISGYRDGLDPHDLVRLADQRLYLAKELGRNRVEVARGES